MEQTVQSNQMQVQTSLCNEPGVETHPDSSSSAENRKPSQRLKESLLNFGRSVRAALGNLGARLILGRRGFNQAYQIALKNGFAAQGYKETKELSQSDKAEEQKQERKSQTVLLHSTKENISKNKEFIPVDKDKNGNTYYLVAADLNPDAKDLIIKANGHEISSRVTHQLEKFSGYHITIDNAKDQNIDKAVPDSVTAECSQESGEKEFVRLERKEEVPKNQLACGFDEEKKEYLCLPVDFNETVENTKRDVVLLDERPECIDIEMASGKYPDLRFEAQQEKQQEGQQERLSDAELEEIVSTAPSLFNDERPLNAAVKEVAQYEEAIDYSDFLTEDIEIDTVDTNQTLDERVEEIYENQEQPALSSHSRERVTQAEPDIGIA